MKRHARMLVPALLWCCGSAAAYDGPGTPLVYNEFINNITVLMTVQPVVLNDGVARLTMTAQVPIESDTIGKDITLQLRRHAPGVAPGYIVLDSCTRTPAPGSVGATVSFTCGLEQFVPVGTGLAAGTFVGIYPYVQRPADSPVSVLTHDGVAARLNVPVVGEDADEPNDTLASATDLGTPPSVVVRNDRVSFLPDYYQVTVPPGAGSMSVRLDFWHVAADIDLYLLDSGGSDLTSSPFTADVEQVSWNVNPGERYYVRVDQAAPRPGFYNLTIAFSIPDIVTLTAGPTAEPAVVAAGGTSTLSAVAVDSAGHTLAYAWSQACPPSIGNGAFGDRFSPTTMWTAPQNTTGSAKQCTLQVVADDLQGHSATATVVVTVGLTGDAIAITEFPRGAPNPVTPPGSVNLTVAASDVFGHPLGYQWTANCPTLPNHGAFAPNAHQRTPAWLPPANLTGATQTCTITVTAGDGLGVTAAAGFAQQVAVSPHLLTITAGPTGTPNPVASGGSALLSVNALDTFAHPLSYTWTATCADGVGGGAFVNAATPAPTWTAPANLSGVDLTCAIQVVVEDGAGLSQSLSYSQTVKAAVNVIALRDGPAGMPNPVASGATATMSVTATDVLGRELASAWTATCTGGIGHGSFAYATRMSRIWTAPANLTGVARSCTMTVIVSDAFGATTTGAYQQIVSPVPNPVTITAAPTGAPNPTPSGGVVAMSVAASDVLGRALSATWTAACAGSIGDGTFTGGSTLTPTWAAPANVTGEPQVCTVGVTIDDGFGSSASGSYLHTVNPAANPITISSGPGGSPNPSPSGATVAMSVMASDRLGRTLSYAWSSACAGGIGDGSFTDARTGTPSWHGPLNATDVVQTCAIQVIVDDGHGNVQTASYDQMVLPPHTLTITSGPSGTPNPVVSAQTAAFTVAALDSIPGHNAHLSYQWSASCLGGGGDDGTFMPSATVREPTWQAPSIPEGLAPGSCVISISVSDGDLPPVTGSFFLIVNPPNAIHTIRFTMPAGAVPNPTLPGGSVQLAAEAVDSHAMLPGHPSLAYAWTASCGGSLDTGAFSPAASLRSPTWMATANTTGATVTCILTVAATDGVLAPVTSSVAIEVLSAPSCAYALAPTATSQSAAAGTGSIAVSTPSGCTWTASSTAPWLRITDGARGTGSGVVTFAVDASQDSGTREATIEIAGQQVPITQAGVGYTYYFAEGATVGGFFETRFALLNPDPTEPATVEIEFQVKTDPTLRPAGAVLTHGLTVAAHSRATLDVSTLAAGNPSLAVLASAEFSTIIRSERPLVADRTVTWDRRGYGSHAETAITAPATTWYLAEGATIGSFELYYLIQNPNPDPLTFTVTYLLPPPAAPVVRTYGIGGSTRTNIPVHLEPGLEDVEVSAIVESPSGKPIIVERAMYLSTDGLFYGAGHESAGITAPATRWFFAEGSTGDFFDLFILIGNPGTRAADITATFLFDDGTTCATTTAVEPRSRFNIWVDTLVIPGCPRSLASAALSTVITSDVPVIAERAMWWPGPTAASWAEAHNAAGATAAGIAWGLADGEQDGPSNSETYILIANTSSHAGEVRVTLYLEDGATLQKTIPLPANGRTTVAVGAPDEGGGFGAAVAGRRFGAVIESLPVAGDSGPGLIVVERAMYSSGPGAPFWAAGTDALATRLR